MKNEGRKSSQEVFVAYEGPFRNSRGSACVAKRINCLGSHFYIIFTHLGLSPCFHKTLVADHLQAQLLKFACGFLVNSVIGDDGANSSRALEFAELGGSL